MDSYLDELNSLRGQRGVTEAYIVAALGLRPDVERVCDEAAGERGSRGVSTSW